MFRFLVLLLIAVLMAFAIGSFVNGEPGYLMLRYRGQVIETSFVLAAILVSLAALIVYALCRLVWFILTAVPRYRRWRTRRRQALAERTLREGLLALAEGKWQRAENLLTRPGVADDVPLLRYLGAAQAAGAREDAALRDRYLKLAHQALPHADAAVWLRQTELYLKEGQWEQARSTLEQLRARFPDNREGCRLARELYELTDDWGSMQTLLPELRQHKLVDREAAEQLERRVAVWSLARAATPQALDAVFNALSPPELRKSSAVFEAHVRGLKRLGEQTRAEALLRKRLKMAYEAGLAELYGELSGNERLRLDFAGQLVAAHPEDPVALRICGDLAMANGDATRARDMYARSVDQLPSALTFSKLAGALEAIGDGPAAMDAYRAGLDVANRARTQAARKTT